MAFCCQPLSLVSRSARNIGALGRDVSFKASPGDLLSHFRFGLMGLFDTRYKRLLLPLDIIMWIRLGDNKALPLPNLMVNTAKLKASEFILGYRLIDEGEDQGRCPGGIPLLALRGEPKVCSFQF